ncbi:hypothetical protein STRIP9103_00353 [Streptomyces ipomoeae 91-03]|uniref:Uncharacterized protein n=1 Tax=Streptomyces ipomoeae 91-03 TaxID=698759 RepID=L1KR13_9ACTN|nr:hypothetical protein STRIP9103_00353 [Streptomyces ipomoeae 91-03]
MAAGGEDVGLFPTGRHGDLVAAQSDHPGDIAIAAPKNCRLRSPRRDRSTTSAAHRRPLLTAPRPATLQQPSETRRSDSEILLEY